MKKSIIILLALVLAVPAFAQGKFGKDSAECVKYLSYYSEYVKQNNLEEAASPWRQAISLCPPTANQNLLLNGTKILRYEIRKTRDHQRRKEIVDSLLMLHDLRSEAYPKYYEKSLDNKAVDAINFLKGNKKLQYEILSDVTSKIPTSCSPVVYVTLMQLSSDLYKSGELDPETVMNNYTTLTGYVEQVIAKNPKDEYISAKASLEGLLIESGVASCDNLIALYTPRYEANPEDAALLNGMVKMLIKSDCLESDLFMKAVESLHRLDPSSNSAYSLYKLYSSRGEVEKAAEALEEACKLVDESDAATAGEYNLELATYNFKKLNKNAIAVAVAKKVPELNPALAGKAYLLIGTIWGSTKCSGNEVEVRSPYWVAVDYMIKAKNADESLATEADNLAAQYRKYFPQQADAFMYDVVDGEGYVVSCGGMREATTVRTIK